MSKARKVSKIFEGELRSDELTLRDGAGQIVTQKDANQTLDAKIKDIESNYVPHEHDEYAGKDHDHSDKALAGHNHDQSYALRVHEHSDAAKKDHDHGEYITTVDSELADEKIQRDIDEHKSTNHRFLELSGGNMDNGADIVWPPNTGTIKGLNKAVDDTSPVRKKEFDEAFDGLSDSDHEHPHDHDREYSKVGHTHEADTAPHTHDEYQPKGDYAAGSHTHPPQDLTHDHDAQYAPVHDHPYAADDHDHPPQDLTHDHDDQYANKTTTNQTLHALAGDIESLESKTYKNKEDIKGKADTDHTHEPQDLTHDHDEFAEIQDKQDEQDARLDEHSARLEALGAGPDTTEYRYHHAMMWYEVAASPGEAWWSDNTKFLCNPQDVDGQTPAASTFLPGKTLGLRFEGRNGSVQVAYIEFVITDAQFVSDSYWEVTGNASQNFPGAADNFMVVNAQPPLKDDEQDTRLDALEADAQALTTRVEDGEAAQADLSQRVTAGEQVQQQLEPKVSKNTQDIQVLKANIQDQMEMVDIESGDWAYGGENNMSPRAGQFGTNSWYFNQADLLFVGQKSTGTTDWTGVQVGDEVRITYNEDPYQPWDERYFGRYVITEIVDKSGINLSCTVEFLDGVGTIVDGKAYTITIRGLRSGSATRADMADDLEGLHKQVDQVEDDFKYRQSPVPWKYRSSSTDPGDLQPGEFTVRMSGDESDGAAATIDFYLNEFDACGARWYPQYGGKEYHHDLSGQFMLTVGMLGEGLSIHAKSGMWTWNVGGNGYAKISGNYRKAAKSLMNNMLYVINFPGYLPMFATDAQITRV